MATEKGIIVRYECGQCHTQHDYEDEAADCCVPRITEVYVCPMCNWEYTSIEEATKCTESHVGIPDLPESCPCCYRPAETIQFRVEIAIAGHCSTCNPIYTPDENLAIKHALEPT